MNDTASLRARAAWISALIPLAAVLVGLVALYWGTASAMVAIWSQSETFTHAYLVPPIVLWLAWRKRATLLQLTPAPRLWVLAPMLVLAVVWLLGQLAAVNAVTQFAFVALLVLAVPLVLGIHVAKVLIFPLAFAFFAVPIGDFALPMLMKWTADFTVGALRLSGVPVFREGLRFVIPSGSWSVVEACSGVRYLIASLMVGALFAYLNYRSNKRRWIFVGLSLLVPVLANWVRAYMIVMLGHLSNNRLATGVDHLVYGWVFFGVVIMALFTIGARWAEPELPDAVPGEVEQVGVLRAAVPGSALWVAAISALVVAAMPVLAQARLDAPGHAGPAAVALSLPAVGATGWQAQPVLDPEWTPKFVNPSAKEARRYTAGSGAQVDVNLLYYRQQRPESKLVSSVNVIVPADDHVWNAISTERRAIGTDSAGAVVVARETVMLGVTRPGRTDRDRLKVWMLYWVDGQWTSSDTTAKVRGTLAKLSGRGDAGAALLLSAVESDAAAADTALKQFWLDNHALIEAQLVAARGARP